MFPQGVSDVVSRPKDTATSEIGNHTATQYEDRSQLCDNMAVFKDAAIYTGEKNQVDQIIIIKHK